MGLHWDLNLRGGVDAQDDDAGISLSFTDWGSTYPTIRGQQNSQLHPFEKLVTCSWPTADAA